MTQTEKFNLIPKETEFSIEQTELTEKQLDALTEIFIEILFGNYKTKINQA